MAHTIIPNLGDSGIIRRADDLGRIVIPKELRRHIKMEENTPCELIPCRDVQGRAIIAIRVYDAFASRDAVAKCRKMVQSLKENTENISIYFASWAGLEAGDRLPDLAKSAAQGFLLSLRTGSKEKEVPIAIGAADDADNNIALVAYPVFAEDDSVMSGTEKSSFAAIFAYGQKGDINAASAILRLAAAMLWV